MPEKSGAVLLIAPKSRFDGLEVVEGCGEYGFCLRKFLLGPRRETRGSIPMLRRCWWRGSLSSLRVELPQVHHMDLLPSRRGGQSVKQGDGKT